jgi:hypothetical protein
MNSDLKFNKHLNRSTPFVVAQVQSPEPDPADRAEIETNPCVGYKGLRSGFESIIINDEKTILIHSPSRAIHLALDHHPIPSIVLLSSVFATPPVRPCTLSFSSSFCTFYNLRTISTSRRIFDILESWLITHD